MNKDFLEMNDNQLDSYINNTFYNMTYQEQTRLLKDENFIRALFSSSGYAFCHLSYLFADNLNLIKETFSEDNLKILNTINDDLVINNLFKMELTKTSSDFLLKINDYKFKYNNNADFTSNLLSKSSIKVQHEFYRKNLDRTDLNYIYKDIRFDKITSKELDLLNSIKERLGSPEEFYSLIDRDSVLALLNQGYFRLFSDKDIANIAHDFYFNKYKDVILPDEILKNKKFIAKLINTLNVSYFVDFSIDILNNLLNSKPQIYLSYKKIFNKFMDMKEEKSKSDLANRFFNDKYDNLMLNLTVILDYCESNPEYRNKIPDNILDVYDKLRSLQENEVDLLYKELLNSGINYESVLYDNLSLARKMFSEEMEKSLTNLNEVEEKIDNVNVHVYKGEDFAFIVHATVDKGGSPKTYADKIDKRLNAFNIEKSPYISTSYINQNNISVFNKRGIIYGFNKLKDMKMVHASYGDSYSSNSSKDSPVTHKPTYLNLDEFTSYDGFSEVLFKPTKLKPDFIVCYDVIDEYDIEVAKKLKIDIALINSKEYENNQNKKSSKNYYTLYR